MGAGAVGLSKVFAAGAALGTIGNTGEGFGNMADDLVSIIIPCYRQAHFLPQALASVFAQSHAAVQAIVVDDGSDDETAAVAARYGTKIHYLRQANQGQAVARNTGIRAAEGKYLIFLDADDMLHPDAVAWQVEAAGGREDRLCMMGHRLFQDDPLQAGLVEFSPAPDLAFYPTFIHECQGTPHCFLSSRRLVVQAGQCTDLPVLGCDDWDLWLRLVDAGAEFVPVARVGAYYRRYAGSMSTFCLKMLQSRALVLLRLHRRMTENLPRVSAWGAELLAAEHRVRRRCLAQGAAPHYAADLSRAILELTRRGFRLKESLPKSLLRRALGEDRAEQWAFRALELFFPERFARYRHGFT